MSPLSKFEQREFEIHLKKGNRCSKCFFNQCDSLFCYIKWICLRMGLNPKATFKSWISVESGASIQTLLYDGAAFHHLGIWEGANSIPHLKSRVCSLPFFSGTAIWAWNGDIQIINTNSGQFLMGQEILYSTKKATRAYYLSKEVIFALHTV